MNPAPTQKSRPGQEIAIRCVPISAAEAAANIRLCVALREESDPASGHFFLLRHTPDARAVLGAICDAGGNPREWLELWIQDVDAMPTAETLVPSNAARDKAWEQLVSRLRGADGADAFATTYEKEAQQPVFIDTVTWRPWHPSTEAGVLTASRDEGALAAAGLPSYASGLARFGRARGGGPFVSLTKAAEGAPGSVSLASLLPLGSKLAPLNPGGGMMFARRFAPLGIEEFSELLGGWPWSGILNAVRPFRLDGVYRQLEDETEMRAGGRHFYGIRRGQAGRLAEVLCLKLLLLDQCIRVVAAEVKRTGLPLLNITPESFRVSLGATGSNLPFCWAARVALVLPGEAIALDVPSSRMRYFATRERPTASIYRPEELGVPRRGIGNVRLRSILSPAEGGIAATGTLSSHERLGVQPNELLRLRLPLKDGGSLELIGYIDAKTAMTAGEANFRTIPLQLDESHSAILRSYEGIPFSQVPFDVLQPLSSPCDLYALGVLGLRLLFAGSELSLPAILDAALSLLRAASVESPENDQQDQKNLETRLCDLMRSDERWLATLGPQFLIRPSGEGDAVEKASLPLEIWCRVLAAILPFFPGRAPESLCRDLADAPMLAPQAPFDAALRTLGRASDTARALFLSDWRQNEEMAGILAERI